MEHFCEFSCIICMLEVERHRPNDRNGLRKKEQYQNEDKGWLTGICIFDKFNWINKSQLLQEVKSIKFNHSDDCLAKIEEIKKNLNDWTGMTNVDSN